MPPKRTKGVTKPIKKPRATKQANETDLESLKPEISVEASEIELFSKLSQEAQKLKKIQQDVNLAITSSVIENRPSNNVDGLLSELESSKNTLLEMYKQSVEKKLNISDKLLEVLKKDSEQLPTVPDGNEVVQLREQLREMEKKLDQSQELAEKAQEKTRELEKAIEKYEVISEITESVCGLRVEDVDDADPDNLVFQCIQAGSNGELHYELTLERLDGDEDEAKMVYKPHLDKSKNVEVLQRVVPEYFFGDLEFPVETLPQFYLKLSRALNRDKSA